MSEPFEINQEWDAIIIGTGMGGATLGYALARAGQRVLFCEKGKSRIRNPRTLAGSFAEMSFLRPEAPQPKHRDILARAGRYHDQIEDQSAARTHTFVPFIGSGSGGSTALYGMALERFFPSDFQPRRHHPAAPETSIPAAWPISYADFAPYYEAAEKLFRVRGTLDPLRAEDPRGHFISPPPLTPVALGLFDFFQSRQLHPYRLPMACEFVPGCACCQGYLCDKNCKNDANKICLEPAIFNHGANLLDECDVLSLEASRTQVTGVVCDWRGARLTLRGKKIILAAGALDSPRILLESASALWPNGLANDSMLVGRNLMRHHVDLYLIDPKVQGQFDNRQKEFAFNDFYQVGGEKLGSVQSFGSLPPAPVVATLMAEDIRQGALPWAAPLFKLAQPIIEPVLGHLFKSRMILATTLEDLPYADNRIAIPPQRAARSDVRLAIHYRIRRHDRERIEDFRRVMKDLLKPYRFTLIKQAENNQRIAHACGTCRFGSDPRESVLDENNRAHALANLYVVDSSFFPSSGGTNPSLTIAANALRVARHLIETPGDKE